MTEKTVFMPSQARVAPVTRLSHMEEKNVETGIIIVSLNQSETIFQTSEMKFHASSAPDFILSHDCKKKPVTLSHTEMIKSERAVQID